MDDGDGGTGDPSSSESSFSSDASIEDNCGQTKSDFDDTGDVDDPVDDVVDDPGEAGAGDRSGRHFNRHFRQKMFWVDFG